MMFGDKASMKSSLPSTIFLWAGNYIPDFFPPGMIREKKKNLSETSWTSADICCDGSWPKWPWTSVCCPRHLCVSTLSPWLSGLALSQQTAHITSHWINTSLQLIKPLWTRDLFFGQPLHLPRYEQDWFIMYFFFHLWHERSMVIRNCISPCILMMGKVK